MKTTTCTHCKKGFEGRANRKFCSSTCKNDFHNERNRDKNSVLTQLNKQLHKNWTVLSKMYEVYKSTPVKLEILEANGFSTKFHTHTIAGRDGGKYTMNYDLGYKPHFDNHIQIVRQDISAVA